MWIQTPDRELSRRFDRAQRRYVPLVPYDCWLFSFSVLGTRRSAWIILSKPENAITAASCTSLSYLYFCGVGYLVIPLYDVLQQVVQVLIAGNILDFYICILAPGTAVPSPRRQCAPAIVSKKRWADFICWNCCNCYWRALQTGWRHTWHHVRTYVRRRCKKMERSAWTSLFGSQPLLVTYSLKYVVPKARRDMSLLLRSISRRSAE